MGGCQFLFLGVISIRDPSGEEVVGKMPIEFVEIVVPSAPVSFGAAEDDHVNSQAGAYLAGAVLPWTVLQNVPIP